MEIPISSAVYVLVNECVVCCMVLYSDSRCNRIAVERFAEALTRYGPRLIDRFLAFLVLDFLYYIAYLSICQLMAIVPW